jgi:hypothetical protein
MKLDLRTEFTEIYRHLADRVRRFDPAANDGPGEGGPVAMIEVGFEYAQAAWVVVVFDTRPDAEPDGEWTLHIDGQELARPAWLAAGESESPLTLVHLDGREEVLPPDFELAVPFGDLLKAVLVQARADGLFAALPKAPGCELGVEHQSGAYGWPTYEERKQENLA